MIIPIPAKQLKLLKQSVAKTPGLKTLSRLVQIMTAPLDPAGADLSLIQVAPLLFCLPAGRVSVLDNAPVIRQFQERLRGYETMTADALILCQDEREVERAICMAHQIFQACQGGDGEGFLKPLTADPSADDPRIKKILIQEKSELLAVGSRASHSGRDGMAA